MTFSTTLCWQCSKPYDKEASSCPFCQAGNGNTLKQPKSGIADSTTRAGQPTKVSEARHTPGQLRVTGDADEWSATHDALGDSCYCGIRDADGTVVALAVAQSSDYSKPDCRPIAKHIVKCVNQHDELRWLVNGFLEWHEGSPCPEGLIERARAAVPEGSV